MIIFEMGKARDPQKSTPNLFGATERRPPPAVGQHISPSAVPTFRLPGDLSKALTFLSDGDIDQLAVAVANEQARRKPPKPLRGIAPKPAKAPAPAKPAPQPLTASRINVIRAAFKAGVKPPTIARQFGVSLSAVRQALETK